MSWLKNSTSRSASSSNEGVIAAINRVQAVIEFDLNGKILHANDNFLRALGYTLEEVVGQHHSMFVDPAYRSSHEYKEFWAKLGRGEYDANQYKRIGKGGKEVWIQASYNPIMDASGKPYKVVKFATDITEQKLKNADFEGQLAGCRLEGILIVPLIAPAGTIVERAPGARSIGRPGSQLPPKEAFAGGICETVIAERSRLAGR